MVTFARKLRQFLLYKFFYSTFLDRTRCDLKRKVKYCIIHRKRICLFALQFISIIFMIYIVRYCNNNLTDNEMKGKKRFST